MTKLRFTDCDKWDDPWFMELPAAHKLLWQYICDKCDNAGVWNVNGRLAEFHLGMVVNWPEAIKTFGGRIVILADGTKWHLTKFLTFQYPGGLGNSNAHKQVARLLVAHGLDSTVPKLMGSGGLLGDFQKSPRLDQTRPDKDKGGVGGTVPREDLKKFLRWKRLSDDDRAVDEFLGFATEWGAQGLASIKDCIGKCSTMARDDGKTARWARDLEPYGSRWTPPEDHQPEGSETPANGAA